MKKKTKIALIAVGFAAVVVSFVALHIIHVWSSGISAPTLMERMESDFRKNEEQLSIVVEYLTNIQYETVFMPAYLGTRSMFVPEIGDVAIVNREVSNALRSLFRFGYAAIDKRENSIVFVRWGNKNREYGIAYSIDGEVPSDGSFDYYAFPSRLSEDNWYYYDGVWRFY